MSREKLCLLYYVESLAVGGSLLTTVTVAREMKRRGHDVMLVSDGGPLKGLLDEVEIPHVRIDTQVRHPSPTIVRRLTRVVREFQVDLLCPNGFDCTLDAVPAGLLTGRPLLPTYGGMYNLPYPHPWLPRVNVFSQELATDLIENHGWPRETFLNLIARIDETRFSPEVSGDRLREELGIDPGETVVVMICRHDRLKLGGVLTLLDAAEALARTVPDLRVVFFGDGNAHGQVLDRIERLHRSSGREFILAPGITDRTAEAFAMADIVVANGARSALEGMACGRVVMSVGPNGFCGVLTARSIEGFRRFNFDKGRLAGNPIADGSNLVSAVDHLLRDDSLRRRLQAFSLAYARKHLIVQTSAAAYEEMYRDALRRRWEGRRRHVIRHWIRALRGYYVHLLGRKTGWVTKPPPGGIAPPPSSLDPDWNAGLDVA